MGDSTEEQCLASGLPMGLTEAVFEVYISKLGSSLPITSLTSFTTEGQGLAEVGEGHRCQAEEPPLLPGPCSGVTSNFKQVFRNARDVNKASRFKLFSILNTVY